jgi:class 3 adenylate cyclase
LRDVEIKQQSEMQALIDDLAVMRGNSERLLEQLLPGDIAERIMRGEMVPPQSHNKCTIFFSDIVGFTSIASEASAMDIVNLLNDLYTYFDAVIDRHGKEKTLYSLLEVYKVETIGDAYMVSRRDCFIVGGFWSTSRV